MNFDERYKKEFKQIVDILRNLVENQLNNEELLTKVNEIKRFENAGGDYVHPSNLLAPLPKTQNDFLVKIYDYADNPEQFEAFINKTLMEQAKLNIERIKSVNLTPLMKLYTDYYQYLHAFDHYVANVPVSTKDYYEEDLKTFKKHIIKMQKESNEKFNSILHALN